MPSIYSSMNIGNLEQLDDLVIETKEKELNQLLQKKVF